MDGAAPVDLARGGSFNSGSFAGPLAVSGFIGPSNSLGDVGFRCAR